MLKRLRPSIGSAHVIALLALFAALGGGYATAFSGSGTLQKAGLSGVPFPGPPPEGFTTVRSLTDVGSIQAICTGGTSPGVFFKNTSGEELAIRGVSGDDLGGNVARFFGSTVSGSNPLAIPIHGGEFIGHIAPTDGSKAPQISLQVSAIGIESCANARINVLALNTQQ